MERRRRRGCITGLPPNPTAAGRTQSAQSAFDVEGSLGAESDARVALIESIGLLPTVQLKVADLRGKMVWMLRVKILLDMITKALAQRPISLQS